MLALHLHGFGLQGEIPEPELNTGLLLNQALSFFYDRLVPIEGYGTYVFLFLCHD
jgi:hypothetical protein